MCMSKFIVMDRKVVAPMLDEVMKAERCVVFSGDVGSQ